MPLPSHNINVHINLNDSFLNMFANIILILYFIYITIKYILEKLDIDPLQLLDGLVHKIVNHDDEKKLA